MRVRVHFAFLAKNMFLDVCTYVWKSCMILKIVKEWD
jgi:hypothetical protein